MNTLKGLPVYDMQILDAIDGVYKISLVDRPAIESDFLLFNEENKKKLSFSDNEKHVITGAAMIPDLPIYRCDETGFEYFVQFSTDTVRKSAELFMKNGFQSNISVDHEFDVEGAYVFESYLVDKSRGISPSDLELPDGSWVVSIKCENDELWDKLKNSDLLHGMSIETINTVQRMAKQNKPEQVEVAKKSLIDMLLKGEF